MTGQVEARLKDLQIELPAPAAPAANYVPYIISGNQLFVSGQLPFGPDGLAFTGKLGEDVDVAGEARVGPLGCCGARLSHEGHEDVQSLVAASGELPCSHIEGENDGGGLAGPACWRRELGKGSGAKHDVR